MDRELQPRVELLTDDPSNLNSGASLVSARDSQIEVMTMTLAKALDTARSRVSRDGRLTSIFCPQMRLWHEVRHATAAYARLYARGALIGAALRALELPAIVTARIINRSPMDGRWESVVRDAAANLDAHCVDVLDSPRETAIEDLRALALAGSQLAAQWLAETDEMASHEWSDWLASEPT